MLLEALTQVWHNFGSAELWLFMSAGIVIGLIFGVIPGVAGMLACALLLPFVFTMTAQQALVIMTAILAVQYNGGSITTILLNIPGTTGNAATLIDGFPMTIKGEGGRAVGAALTSSAAGSLLSGMMCLVMIPLVLPIIMALRMSDMVFIVLLGLTFIAALGTGSMIKGLISGGVGLLISLIGCQPSTGVARFTFGSMYLYDGVPMVPLALGLFAVPEMIALAARGGSLAKTRAVIKGMQNVWQGARDVLRHWRLVVRSSIIGFIVGIVPGVGPSVAAFISYGQAKQTSKHPEQFGKGCVEGVIAPESANNSEEAGALLTTVALGIPGNASWAVVLGAFIMLGIVPGPEMMTKHLDLSITLALIVPVAGVLATAVTLPLATQFSKIAFVPGRMLVPLVLVITLVGAFAFEERIIDVDVVLLVAVVGLVMRIFDFNRPAAFLGYILGSTFERYLFMAYKLGGPLFFLKPISLAIIFIIVFAFAYGPIKELLQRRRGVKRV